MKPILAGLLMALAGCDPSWYLHPDGWTKSEEHSTWLKRIGDLEIEIQDIGGLIGQSHAGVEIVLRNRGTVSLTLERIDLDTRRGTFSWDPLEPDRRYRIDPGESVTVPASWFFPRSDGTLALPKVLADRCRMALRFKGSLEIPVEFVR